MKNYNFWKKISDYSIFVCLIIFITEMFFRKYLENIINRLLFLGVIMFLVFLLAELMKFISKRK